MTTAQKLASSEAQRIICEELLRIMITYHKQKESFEGVDSPGGLEYMGDVWRLFLKWEKMLRGSS